MCTSDIRSYKQPVCRLKKSLLFLSLVFSPEPSPICLTKMKCLYSPWTAHLEFSLISLDLGKHYYNSQGTCESALACRTLVSVLSFLPIEDTANPVKYQGLPGQPGSTIIGEREIQGSCACHREGGNEGRKEANAVHVVIAAAVWQCHHDEGVCFHRRGLWGGGSWDKTSCSSLEWGKTCLGLCKGRNLKIQAEWPSCWLILHGGTKKVIKRSQCSCSKAFTHPQLQCSCRMQLSLKGKGCPFSDQDWYVFFPYLPTLERDTHV